MAVPRVYRRNPNWQSKRTTESGARMSSEYYTWQSARYRCHNPKAKAFKNYGGRGIIMCERWRDSFAMFMEDMGLRPVGHELDRIDNNGPYSRDNCRWVSCKTQQRNKRDNHRVTVDGVTRTIAEWSERHGIPTTTIATRIFARGWTEQRAVTEPSGNGGWQHPRALTLDGQTRTIAEWSDTTGLPIKRIHDRLNKGWSIERALQTRARRRVDGHYVT